MTLDWQNLTPAEPKPAAAKKRGAKRGDPAYTSSSFFVRKDVTLAFDRALLDLRGLGSDLDRSTALEMLMGRFTEMVDELLIACAEMKDASEEAAAVAAFTTDLSLPAAKGRGKKGG